MCISLEDPWSGLRLLTFIYILTTLHRPETWLLGPRTYALSSWGHWGLWPDAPSKLQENHPSTGQRARFASTIPERRRSRNPHASRLSRFANASAASRKSVLQHSSSAPFPHSWWGKTYWVDWACKVPPLLLERQTSKVKNSKNIEETTPVKKNT